MSYFTRDKQAVVPGAVKKYSPDQPRDKQGRWTAVRHSRGTYSVGYERERGGHDGIPLLEMTGRSEPGGRSYYSTLTEAKLRARELNQKTTKLFTL